MYFTMDRRALQYVFGKRYNGSYRHILNLYLKIRKHKFMMHLYVCMHACICLHVNMHIYIYIHA